ncbi:bifunctional 4-hydroxy-2-oxoglutarate aldolase/2-dehydro-3-deoxy-phosphogluconate aldolase [Arthrobacter sp. Sa2CUA1]|uniref:Bifunctional 4-hydroxy-2-oxoglutarate aldolase/2-dehydro-3-deoxy-phosphogluconate aldolase n=2 Tax=Arthrobacter gallicola TaxID=2762225 RepID=A0ABR8UTU1_9MICC|nr:bifunctional 4-hydroxy-2-oxoglutarate aldolase/2-dehydro-3-deoxy-phosphogluconate aldolase [Arthrobacter gallicola]
MNTDTPSTSRPVPSELLRAHPVIAVLRAGHASEYAPVVEALIRGGVTSIELTLSTAGVFAEMPALVSRFAGGAEIGVGTITSEDEAEQALDCGAQFLVTPAMSAGVVDAAVRRNVPVFPGGFTPTELLTGWSAGATAVKLFPASVVGKGYLAHLRGPFPGMQVIPSGGVSIEDAPAWIGAGALAVSLGGPLIGDAFAGGSLEALTERARRASALVAEAAAAVPGGAL